MTCFAFSTENWNRSPEEIEGLMTTFVEHCDEILRTAKTKKLRVRLISSDPDRLPEHVLAKLQALERETTEENGASARLALNLAVSYGARSEIANAARDLAESAQRGEIDATADVTEAALAARLALGTSPPDLLVRTSGEARLSNFLLWQLAYTELVFLDVYWPDLSRSDFLAVLEDYATRHRRFGT